MHTCRKIYSNCSFKALFPLKLLYPLISDFKGPFEGLAGACKNMCHVNVFTFSHISLKRIYEIRIALLEAVDSSFGRLDYASLSQQALMEMVIEGIANKEKICGDANEPNDIEEWEGVTVEDGEVVEIAW